MTKKLFVKPDAIDWIENGHSEVFVRRCREAVESVRQAFPRRAHLSDEVISDLYMRAIDSKTFRDEVCGGDDVERRMRYLRDCARWLFRETGNRRKRTEPLNNADQPAKGRYHREIVDVRADSMNLLEEVKADLTPVGLRIVELRHEQGLSWRQTAQAMGWKEQSVKVSWNKILRVVRATRRKRFERHAESMFMAACESTRKGVNDRDVCSLFGVEDFLDSYDGELAPYARCIAASCLLTVALNLNLWGNGIAPDQVTLDTKCVRLSPTARRLMGMVHELSTRRVGDNIIAELWSARVRMGISGLSMYCLRMFLPLACAPCFAGRSSSMGSGMDEALMHYRRYLAMLNQGPKNLAFLLSWYMERGGVVDRSIVDAFRAVEDEIVNKHL